jgi:hypothetical protein
MKSRNGFVSNSSSTSFYVPECDKKKAEDWGLELTSVKNIIKSLKALEPVDFLLEWNLQANLERLEGFGDGYISSPYDRDDAYTSGLDQHWVAFETDL